jgi:hypothetical protein
MGRGGGGVEIKLGDESEETGDMSSTWANSIGCVGVTLIVAALLGFMAWLVAGHPGVQ